LFLGIDESHITFGIAPAGDEEEATLFIVGEGMRKA
jgi:hypothetical protein